MRETQHLFGVDQDLPADEAETSSNFDIQDVIPFLEGIADLPGASFNAGLLAFKSEMIADIPLKETRSFEIVGHVNGQLQLLTIEAYMSAPNAPDLRFIGQKALIDMIDAQLIETDDID